MPKTPRQRLASVMGKCFVTKSAKTQDELRHAVLSAKLEREIVTSADLTDTEVGELLTLWEHHLSPFSPSDRGIKEIHKLAHAYQVAHQQTEMELTN